MKSAGIIFLLVYANLQGAAHSNPAVVVDKNTNITKKKVIIVGAGSAGLLFAHNLLRKPNYEIHLLEKRSDPRTIPPSEQRTYPISLQQKRGLYAIREISPSMSDAVEDAGAWMKGYFGRLGDVPTSNKIFKSPMLALDRNELSLVLLEHLVRLESAENSSIELHFNTALEDVNLDDNTISVTKASNGSLVPPKALEKLTFDCLIGADGSQSIVRRILTAQDIISSTATRIPIDALSLRIPRASSDGDFYEVQDGQYNGWMLQGGVGALALPLSESECSGAINFPQNNNPFQNMTSPDDILEFFERSAPKTLAKLVSRQEATNLLERPVSRLYSVRCDQIHVKDKVLLVGDAAHATSNNLGQGANSALQDVQLFFRALSQTSNDNWDHALTTYSQARLPCLRAVRELSEFVIPQSPKMMKEFLFRSKIRNMLPPWLGPLVVGHDAMQLLADTDLSYSRVHRKTRRWIARVKKANFKHAARQTSNE